MPRANERKLPNQNTRAAILACVLVVTIGLNEESAGAQTSAPAAQMTIAPSYKTPDAQVSGNAKFSQSGDPRLQKEIRGLVVPRHQATISSRLQATIRTIGPDNGERFKKGDKLIIFDCAIHKAELMRAEAQMNAAEDTYRVKAELARNGSISKLQPVLARAELKKAEAERVLSAEHVAHCAITAPYDGRVVRRLANAHETVSFGDPLVEIVNDHEVELQLFVPSNWLVQMKIGATFRFHIDETGKVLPAKIIAIGAWIDNVSQLIEIRAICSKGSDTLIAGMSGKAEFGEIK